MGNLMARSVNVLSGEIMDEEDEEYRPCDESELTNIHYEDCECEEWDELRVELYSYPIYRKTCV